MTEKRLICPVCDRGTLTERTYKENFKLDQGTVPVEGLTYCECDSCGADPVLKEQLRRNHRRVIDAQRYAGALSKGKESDELRIKVPHVDSPLLSGTGR